MTMNEFYLYQEQLFDSYSKRTIKYIGIDIYREEETLAKRELSLSSLSCKEEVKLSCGDTYHWEDDTYLQFELYGLPIVIRDPLLGKALFSLPPKRRDVLLLFYFAGKNEPQIGRLLHISTSAVNRRRHTALNRLKELLEEMDYGA